MTVEVARLTVPIRVMADFNGEEYEIATAEIPVDFETVEVTKGEVQVRPRLDIEWLDED